MNDKDSILEEIENTLVKRGWSIRDKYLVSPDGKQFRSVASAAAWAKSLRKSDSCDHIDARGRRCFKPKGHKMPHNHSSE